MSTFDYATIIILDIGRNVDVAEKNEESFFLQARQCASRIIERNIMIQSKNLVGLILLGASKTNNFLNEQCPGAFKYIDVVSDLKLPTWQMIRDLPDQPTKRRGDWFEALIVAAHHYKDGVSGIKLNSRKIVLITNFEYPANISSRVDEVISGFQEESLEIFIIGPDLNALENDDIKVARLFVEETNGDQATFEEAMKGWKFHKKRAATIRPQNFDLSIGPNIKIPVSLYIRVRNEPVVKNWKKSIKDPVTGTCSTTEGVTKTKTLVDAENQSAVTNVETLKGYLYGQMVIPFSENDESMLYKSGEKSISLYGFTHLDAIKWQYLNGDGTYYLMGRKGDHKSQETVTCLVQCLHELKLVGIVRKVFHARYEPKMLALMPVIDIANDCICLSLVNICYKEEIKNMAFPTTELKKYATTNEQVTAFKDLISAMNLTKAYDDEVYNDTEAFPIGETVSPSIQYLLDCIAYRAMNPDKPLPQPRDEIMALFKLPPLIEKRSREPLENLKKMFSLNKIEVKKFNRKKNQDSTNGNLAGQPMDSNENVVVDVPVIKLPSLKEMSEDVTRIGTADPGSDFITLLGKGKTVLELSPELTDIIESLVYANFVGDYTKVWASMKCFRDECVKTNPLFYNNWLQKFKRELIERKKDTFLNSLSDKNLNLILKTENNLSTFTEENRNEDSEMYDADTIPDSTELSIRSDVNDMFEDM